MISPLVVAITLNWNRREDTLECVESLCRLTYPNVRLLVVDNGSTDGSPGAIAKHFPQVEQIVNPANLGFARGFNVGLRRALEVNAEFAFILNNDTYVAPDMLGALVKASEPTDVGIAAPAIYYASDPKRIWSTGGGHNPLTLEMTGDHGRREPIFDVTERDFVVGCGMLIKRAVLERVGLFDERFFMYYEDSDYCLRARRHSFRLVCVPQARMWHKVASSSNGSDSPAERYLMAKSSAIFFRKHVRGWRWLIIGLYRFGSAIKTTFRLSIHRRFVAARAYWRGLRDGLME